MMHTIHRYDDGTAEATLTDSRGEIVFRSTKRLHTLRPCTPVSGMDLRLVHEHAGWWDAWDDNQVIGGGVTPEAALQQVEELLQARLHQLDTALANLRVILPK